MKTVALECEKCHRPYVAYEHQAVWHSNCPHRSRPTDPMPRYVPSVKP